MIDKSLSSFAGISAMGPVLTLFGTALLLLLLDIVLRAINGKKSGAGNRLSMAVSIAGLIASAVWAVTLYPRVVTKGATESVLLFTAKGFPDPDHQTSFWTGGAIQLDAFALTVCLLAAILLILGTILLASFLRRQKLYKHEIYPLLLLSGSGMMLLGYSHDLLVTFIAIEILSLPLYVLCGLNNRSQAGQESSLKYFLLGAFASGFFVYGMALVYGITGSLDYRSISFFVQNYHNIGGMLLAGMIMIGVGLAFKIALVPFHAWVPDVYQGAPTPVTAIMAAGVKLAVFAAAQRIIYTCFIYVPVASWQTGLAVFAAASMLVGNLFALHQISLKRLLAYSAITHTGYLAVALCAGTAKNGASMMVYLFAYGLATLGAFGLISYLAPKGQDDVYLDELHEFSHRAPLTALALVILLLSMAGFPMTAGFIGKLLVFSDAWQSGLRGLVLFALINSVISAYFYLRVVMAMYLQPRVPGGAVVEAPKASTSMTVVGVVSVILTLLFGLLPQFMIDIAARGLPR